MNHEETAGHADRILEEWKANNDLYKFHEDLKQKRLSYFIAIQTAFIALYGIVLKEALIQEHSVWALAIVIVVVFPPLLIVLQYTALDDRARAYIDTIKGKLLLLEEDWKRKIPDNCFSTYSEQFAVLVHRNEEIVNRYIVVRRLKEKDPFSAIIKAKPAHVGEKQILQMFKILWIFALIATVAIFCLRLRSKF